jgi:hypothetical protein
MALFDGPAISMPLHYLNANLYAVIYSQPCYLNYCLNKLRIHAYDLLL